jgi:hypothetical protein
MGGKRGTRVFRDGPQIPTILALPLQDKSIYLKQWMPSYTAACHQWPVVLWVPWQCPGLLRKTIYTTSNGISCSIELGLTDTGRVHRKIKILKKDFNKLKPRER